MGCVARLTWGIGTTAAGKSRVGQECKLAKADFTLKLAVEVAKALNGEVINGDSLQVYKSSDIVTNKIPESERDGVEHHLMDFVDPVEDYDVTHYVASARKVMDAIAGRNKLPILVGGTHYYLQSLLFPHRLMPAAKKQEQSHPILKSSSEDMLAFLKQVDPVMAQRWHPRDTRKIRRCVEIYLEHGVPPSEIYAQQKQESQKHDGSRVCLLWLYTQPEVLAERINKRTHDMLKQGAEFEFRALHDLELKLEAEKGPVDLGSGIFKTIGYKEFREYFRSGGLDGYDCAVDGMRLATRNYAKNQIKWIRNTLIPLCENIASDDVTIYLLDSSDASRWDEDVLGIGLNVLKNFYNGTAIDPRSTSALASTMLLPRKNYLLSSRPDLWEVNICEICSRKGSSMVFNTKADWDHHLQTRKHRGAMRKAARGIDWVQRQRNKAAQRISG